MSQRRSVCTTYWTILAAAILFAIGATPASAVERDHLVFSETAPFVFENPCNGELFTGTVRFHFMTTDVASARTINSIHYDSAQLRGESASGALYVGGIVSVEHGHASTTGTNDQMATAHNPTFHVIRQGEVGTQDDFLSHVLLITKIENDTVVFSIEHVRSECR